MINSKQRKMEKRKTMKKRGKAGGKDLRRERKKGIKRKSKYLPREDLLHTR